MSGIVNLVIIGVMDVLGELAILPPAESCLKIIEGNDHSRAELTMNLSNRQALPGNASSVFVLHSAAAPEGEKQKPEQSGRPAAHPGELGGGLGPFGHTFAFSLNYGTNGPLS
jgi:hypothetical protein